MNQQFNERIADLNQQFNERIADLNQRFDDMNKRFDDMNKRFDDMNQRLIDLSADVRNIYHNAHTGKTRRIRERRLISFRILPRFVTSYFPAKR